MRHLELHIIQSVPVACLNRDDLNSPKTAVFGGVQRARVSSQAWKRAIRELLKVDSAAQFGGQRSRLFMGKITDTLVALGEKKEDAEKLSSCAGHYLAKLDPKQQGRVKTLVFLSPEEIQTFGEMLHSLDDSDKRKLIDSVSSVDLTKLSEETDEEPAEEDAEPKEDFKSKKSKNVEKVSPAQFKKIVDKVLAPRVKKAFGSESLPKDAADIALFGRMVANDPSLKVEAASMFSHALSTHKADNEIDFFAAVDDLQPTEESGAGMTSTLEFNSATYYRFAALDLDMLKDDEHLGSMTLTERRSVVQAFVEATIKAIPGARKNTMNGNTLPTYVLGVVRTKGHPVQLVNAFENPVRPGQGYAEKSVELLKNEYAKLKETWGLEAVYEKGIPEPQVALGTFLKELAEHVV